MTTNQHLLKFPESDRLPVAWFVRLVRALAEADHSAERAALAELMALGYRLEVDPRNRIPGLSARASDVHCDPEKKMGEIGYHPDLALVPRSHLTGAKDHQR